MTKDIKIEDYNYPLPDDRIAKYPLPKRDSSKLLVWQGGNISQDSFANISDYLSAGELLIYNNTKVIQARLHFNKDTGAKIEIFCLEPHTPSDYNLIFQSTSQCAWSCMIGNAKKWKNGTLHKELTINNTTITLYAEKIGTPEDNIISFSWNDDNITFGDILHHLGELPIPPYLNRNTEESDKQTYQTVYSRIDGSVAAPTAGLHFTPQVLENISNKGVLRDELTLHVGAGTFKPVKTKYIGEHAMHQETISVNESTIRNIIASLGKITAVGTTSVRTLESLYYIGLNISQDKDLNVEQWQPYQDNDCNLSTIDALNHILQYLQQHNITSINAQTKIIIAPGYKFRIVNKIITNFHQPQSTLLLLISAFVGENNWKSIYDYALNNDFRFLSYGDSSLLTR